MTGLKLHLTYTEITEYNTKNKTVTALKHCVERERERERERESLQVLLKSRCLYHVYFQSTTLV